jgi:hypothetical protein
VGAESPDKGFEEHFSSSGLGKEGPGGSGRAPGGVCVKWYQSEKISLFSVTEEKRKFHHAAEKR